VPSGFTPNGDGHNDILRAIPIGIKEFKFFAVYNRWGQLVFYTTNAVSGWDGKFNGALQNAGAYVWVTEGIDYQGITIDRKGVAVLIR
jgi:gliding motility-associated-like protein